MSRHGISAKLRRGLGLMSMLLVMVLVTTVACRRAPADVLDVDREIRFGLKSAQAGLWNEALYRWERAVEVRPGDSQLHNNLAVAYEHEGRYDEAELEYEKAHELAPGNEYIRLNLEAFQAFYAAFIEEGSDEDALDETEEPEQIAEGPGR